MKHTEIRDENMKYSLILPTYNEAESIVKTLDNLQKENITSLEIFVVDDNSPDGTQQYVNCELPDVQAGFRKGRGTRHQIAKIRWIMEKAREFQKNIYFCFIDYTKAEVDVFLELLLFQ